MGVLLQDLRYGLRMLAKTPGFTAVAIITLALGIGATTAVFSVVNGVLLEPLPFRQPGRLAALYSNNANFRRSSISYPNFLDWASDNHSFSGLAAFRSDEFDLTGMGEPERVPVEMISANLFSLLGVEPVIGRTFRSEEDHIGAAPVVMISYGLWKHKFGASRDVLGKPITLNGTSYVIVGVVPAKFAFYSGNGNFHPSDVYVPIGQWREALFWNRATGMGMDAVGRLRPGVTLDQAGADMNALALHLAEEYPDADRGTGITLLPLKQDAVGDIQPYLILLLAAVGFVLLIACVNVANLMLARSTARTREFAIRISLGAGRGRVIRQLLTESILLALAGGGVGLLLASWGLQGALKVLPEALPRADAIHLDGLVLAFTLAASVLVGILFGLAPALKTSSTNLQETLKEGGRGTSGERHRAQSIFVVAEVAIALVLLAGAGLMIRSLAKLWGVDPGFDPHHVLTFNSSFPPISSPDLIRATWRDIEDRLETVPGIEAASVTIGSEPMQGDSELPFWVEGQPKPQTQSQMKETLFYLVQPDYLKVMRIPLERGRFITAQDDSHAPIVTVIDKRFARLYFPGQNPVGKRINFAILGETAEIVGVVGHVKQWGLNEASGPPLRAQCYLALAQVPDKLMTAANNFVGAVVRTEGSPVSEVSAIRQAMDRINSNQVMYGIETMNEVISNSLGVSEQRFAMTLLGIFAALALVMACVGIYGVISYLAGQRTHEIGIRMALGARRWDIFRMVLGRAAEMALFGVAIGLTGAFGLTWLMASVLFGVSAHDPLTFAAVAVLLTLVVLLASYIPARRAARVDPMVALRYE